MDEKTQIQALDRWQPLQPMRPGQAERRTHDYVRHGTTSLFAALEVKTGRVVGDFHARHRSVEFRKFLDRSEAAVPAVLDVHLVGQLRHAQNTSDPSLVGPASAVSRALHADQRLLAEFGRALVRRPDRKANSPCVHRSTRELDEAIRQYIAASNRRSKPFVLANLFLTQDTSLAFASCGHQQLRRMKQFCPEQ